MTHKVLVQGRRWCDLSDISEPFQNWELEQDTVFFSYGDAQPFKIAKSVALA